MTLSQDDLALSRWASRYADGFYELILEHLEPTITIRDLRLLCAIAFALHDGREISMGELAAATGYGASSVNRMKNFYASAGMLSERRHPNDARITLIRFSDSAIVLHLQWCEKMKELNRSLQSQLPADR